MQSRSFTQIILTVSIVLGLLDLSAKEDSYFAEVYAQVNNNIEQGLFEDNLNILEAPASRTLFEALNCYEKGRLYHKVGVSAYMIDKEDIAIRFFRDSVLAIWKDCLEVPQTEKANTTYNLGISFQYTNNFEAAKKYLDEALWVFENAADYPPLSLAKKYHGTASFYLDLNDPFRTETVL